MHIEPGRRWGAVRSSTVSTVLFLLLVTALQWWQAWASTTRLRQDTLAQAELRAAQVSSAAAELVSLLLQGADATARELVASYLAGNGPAFEAGVAQAIDRLPQGAVLQVAVIGADGYLAYSNLGMTGERLFLGDREHFKAHLEDGSGDRFFISRPVMGRVSRQWSVQFTRPIRKGGRLVGVMVLSMSPAYLRDAMAKVTLDSDDTLAVLGRSGEYLARNQAQDAALGKVFDARRSFQPPAPADGMFNGRSPIDGVERIFQWQRLDDYPVTVLLGLSRAKVVGPTERVISEINFKAAAGTVLLWTASGVFLLLLRRIRAQVRRREEVEYLAMHDTLTGLNSRFALMKHLEAAIATAAAGGGTGRVGVLYMDLDGFKPVNDQYGHAVGDQVLQAVAGRLRNCVRGNDFPARIGGDEFVVVVGALTDDASLVQLGDRISEALARPLSVNGAYVRIGASIGLAVFPENGRDADALLVHADKAMYEHKAYAPRGA